MGLVLTSCSTPPSEALGEQLKARKAVSADGWAEPLRAATDRTAKVLRDGRSGLGGAVPVTRDGYFLTAKHCVAGGAPVLHWGDTEVLPARVVWTSSDTADLALLHASVDARSPFVLADINLLEEGAPVGATGWSGLLQGATYGGVSAGQVLRVVKRGGAPSWWRVEHDVPVVRGDSGGALLDASGQLVGIHSGGKVGLMAIYEKKPEGAPLRGFKAISNLPERSWLEALIEADRRRRPTE